MKSSLFALSRYSAVGRRIAAFVLIAGVFAGASQCKRPQPVDLTILHTNDLHSHLHPYSAGFEKNPYQLGGPARLKRLADTIRAKKGNTILLDAGDWAEATMHFTADAGSNMLRLMSAIGYNAAVVGNHDFLNNPTEMANAVERARPSFAVLAANKDLSRVSDAARIAAFVPDSTIVEVGSGSSKLRVGVIGLLTDEYFYYEYFKPGTITNPVDKAAEIANRMYKNNLADLIVVLSHNSFAKHPSWAKIIPWINVIISGHSHVKTPQPVVVQNAGQPVYVAEAGHSGMFLGDMTLTVDLSTRQVKLKSYQLHPISADIPEDPVIAAMVAEEDRKLDQRFGEDVRGSVVAHADDEFRHLDGAESPLANFAAEAYRLATGTPMAMEANSLVGEGFAPGKLSPMDLFNVAPHIFQPIPGLPFPEYGKTWTLKTMSFRGYELELLLNGLLLGGNVDIGMGWISLSGAKVSYSYSAGANPIRTLEILNPQTGAYEPVAAQRAYSVTIHDGLLLAVRILVNKLKLPLDLSSVQETGIQTWQAVRALATSRGTLRAADYDHGVSYRSLEADLALNPHQVSIRQDAPGSAASIEVRLRNDGSSAVTPGSLTLRANRGKPNDAIYDGTEGNESIAVGTAAIPELAPGQTTALTIPFAPPTAGVYALRLSISGKDGNATNNSIVVHARIR